MNFIQKDWIGFHSKLIIFFLERRFIIWDNLTPFVHFLLFVFIFCLFVFCFCVCFFCLFFVCLLLCLCINLPISHLLFLFVCLFVCFLLYLCINLSISHPVKKCESLFKLRPETCHAPVNSNIVCFFLQIFSFHKHPTILELISTPNNVYRYLISVSLCIAKASSKSYLGSNTDFDIKNNFPPAEHFLAAIRKLKKRSNGLSLLCDSHFILLLPRRKSNHKKLSQSNTQILKYHHAAIISPKVVRMLTPPKKKVTWNQDPSRQDISAFVVAPFLCSFVLGSLPCSSFLLWVSRKRNF